MHIKTMLKKDLSSNEIKGYYGRQKITWGYLSFYVRQTKKNKWNCELYWTDPTTGQDNTILIEKNRAFEDLTDVLYYLVCNAKYYFEDLELLQKIMSNIKSCDDLLGTL